MKSWIPFLMVLTVGMLAFLAPRTHAGDKTDGSVSMEAKLTGLAPMGGYVHYEQNLKRIRIKTSVWGIKVPNPRLVLDGDSYRLIMDPVAGTGYSILDTRSGKKVVLKPGSKVSVMVGPVELMTGVMTKL
jgi:hypothetical protein